MDKVGYWQIITKPALFKDSRISATELKKTIDDTKVILRGWDFPHYNERNVSPIADGILMRTDFLQHKESFCVYSNGLFVFQRELWEDHEKPYGGEATPDSLDFINVIWSVTEFFLFFKRFYEKIAANENISIRIFLDNIKGRELTTSNSVAWYGEYFCTEENSFLYEKEIASSLLSASSTDLANEFIRDLFRLFDCSMSEATVKTWQMRLIEKKF
jgi:hypothetical protein